MRVYATRADLDAYLTESKMFDVEVPCDVDRFLSRASGLVERAVRFNTYATDDEHYPSDPELREAFRLATCAQVGYWVELSIRAVLGEAGVSGSGEITREKVGTGEVWYATNVAQQIDARTRSVNYLVPEARDHLSAAGMRFHGWLGSTRW